MSPKAFSAFAQGALLVAAASAIAATNAPIATAAGVQAESTTTTNSSATQISQLTQVSFSDVSNSYWATPFIAELARLDIIEGFPDETYRPNEPVTKAQFAAVLRQAFELREVRQAVDFTDVSNRYWAYSAVREAYQMGFFGADSDRQFNPTQRLTRLDLLVALARGLNYTSTTGSVNSILAVYSDAASIPAEARTLIAALTEKGLIVNYPNSKRLELNRVATRAEVASFIYQSLVTTGRVTSISSPYIVSQAIATSTQTTTSTEAGSSTSTETEAEIETETETSTETTTGSSTSTETTTGTSTSTSGITTSTGTETSGSSSETTTASSTVTLTNGYRVSYLGVTYGSGTSTWRYRVVELPEAQDLSNWVLGLPSCARVVNASPKGEVVNPDPNAKISGIKWQPGGGFVEGDFSVTVNGEWTVGEIDVAVKGPDVALGRLAGPSCTSR
uniref:S-layer homology domain-containing protein n=1 Tax=Trichocoleus desertorum TaxID=1481672 RepID=UPI0025B2CD1F|nr:S-layer homology domain-containing protein [Trichocoleus desertorum]